MFPLGHVGIGTHVLPPRIREQLRWRWLVVGCLLPDVIDKPLFIAARLLHRPGADRLYLLHGSRLFGHTLFFLAALFVAGAALHSEQLRAIGILDEFLEPALRAVRTTGQTDIPRVRLTPDEITELGL